MRENRTWRLAVLTLAWAVGANSAAYAADLFVYSLNIADNSYQAVSPHLQWSPASVSNSAASGQWVSADQYLAIQTDQKHQQGNWTIQVFTDNTRQANAGASFNNPDYFVGGAYVSGGASAGAATPVYKGLHQIRDRQTNANVLPKGGLISNDGLERIPLIWRFYDDLPLNRQVPPIVEMPLGSACDFNFPECSWFYFLDKGDLVNVSMSPPAPYWLDQIWYVSPLTEGGALYSVPSCAPRTTACSARLAPTTSGGWTTQYLYVAANFKNGSRQVYSTTLFVELLLQ